MNQKNHYVSTYQKDYTWPHVSGVCRTQPTPTKSIIAVKACTCADSQRVFKELLNADLDWSRIGPMGRLLEPKVYPKIGQTPDATRFDQPPGIFMRKFEEQCSGLSGVLKKVLSDKVTARVDADRMKTTYQADYSDPAVVRMQTQRDTALAVIDTNGRQLQCRMPIKITIEEFCPPRCRPSSLKNGSTSVYRHDYKRKNESKCGNKREGVERGQMLLPSWKSEYQDSINKIGHTIMRAKLHHTKRKTIPVQYQHCTMSS